MKQGHIGLDSAFGLWLLGHFKLRIFRLSMGHPELECEALSFLLQLNEGNSLEIVLLSNKDILAWIRRLVCGCLAISS